MAFQELLPIFWCLIIWAWQAHWVPHVPWGTWWLLLSWGFALYLGCECCTDVASKTSLYSFTCYTSHTDARWKHGGTESSSPVLMLLLYRLLLALQKPSNGAEPLKWSLSPSPQPSAKGDSRVTRGISKFLPWRSRIRKSEFKKMGEAFQQNLIRLWWQPCRKQHKKIDCFSE